MKYVILNNHDSIFSCVTCWCTYFYFSSIFRSCYKIRLNQHLRFVFNTYEMSLKRCWPLTTNISIRFNENENFAFFYYVLQLETHNDWHYYDFFFLLICLVVDHQILCSIFSPRQLHWILMGYYFYAKLFAHCTLHMKWVSSECCPLPVLRRLIEAYIIIIKHMFNANAREETGSRKQ